jgi:predicted O-methyltransferase YrrM
MIDLTTIEQWQWRDEKTGLRLPYYTKPFLDELATWDLSEKNIFEYGLGASTIYYVNRAKTVCGVDEKKEWIDLIYKEARKEARPSNLVLMHHAEKNDFVNCIYDFPMRFDIVVIDGDYWRDECVVPAINKLSDGGVIIIDNWLQPSVWMAREETQGLLNDFDCKIYKQEGHPDWQTAVFIKK